MGDKLTETVERLRELLAKVDLPLVQLQDSKGFSRIYSAPEEPHFRTGDLLAETFGDGDDLFTEAINALPDLLAALTPVGEDEVDPRGLIVAYLRHLADLRPADANGLRVAASDIEARFDLDSDLNPAANQGSARHG